MAEEKENPDYDAQADSDIIRCLRYFIHDIRHPLTALRCGAEILGKYSENLQANQFKSGIETIAASTDILIENFEEIEGYIKGIGANPVVMTPDELKFYLEKRVTPMTPVKGISYKLEMNIGTEPIYLCRGFVMRSTINAAINAQEAGGTRMINRYSKNSSHMIISFSDNGAGMDEETLEKCGQTDFTTKQTGHGLGLSYTKEFMRTVGGYVEIKSNKNHGTDISLYYPLEKLQPPAEASSQTQ